MDIPVDEKMDVRTRLREAETYHQMGLLGESLEVYEQIIAGKPALSPNDVNTIRERIEKIRTEIREHQGKPTRTITAEDMSLIKQALAVNGKPSEILGSAAAFRELGLIREAVKEYERLLGMNFPVESFVPEMIDCMLDVYAPSKLMGELENMMTKQRLRSERILMVTAALGKEMEKRGHKEEARNLFKTALQANPNDGEIKEKVSTLSASITAGSKYDYLLEKGTVTADQLQKALALAKKTKKSVETILIESFHVRKDDVGKSLSIFYSCPFKAFDPTIDIPVELLKNLKKSFLMHDLWVPMKWSKEGVEIVVDNPKDPRKTDHIRALTKTKKIIFSVGIKEDIERYINLFYQERGSEEVADNMFEDLEMLPEISFEEEEERESVPEDYDEASGEVVRLVDQVLVAAYRKNSSDIHIEPSPLTKRTDIRFRMDGVCQNYIQVPNIMCKAIVSRLKIMAGLDIAERRLPQDGKIKFRRKGIPSFELRLATIPTTGGYEDAVLRVLPKSGAMKLDDMGLHERNLAIMKTVIAQPYGLVLVVGPTGSGKTTTLHAALGYINKPGIKIWTAEDPVEITQPGLRQVEVKPKIGLDFARIMRAFLRADPDVIMIGEMRDHETAAIGVEASLTGHLVFSTLHTNSAPETVTRLLDMGLNPLNFSDAFLGVLAQRLVRRLCKGCREAYNPSEEEFEEIVQEYGKEYFPATGIKYSKDLKIYRPKGCEECSNTGYKGRLGIHELMEGTKEIKNMIKRQANSAELFIQSMKEGMTTLKQDGIMKVFQGITDISEVRRVCIN